MPAGRDGSASASIDLGTLAGESFLVPRIGTSCADMIQRACARAGFVPRVVARATDFEVLLSLVAEGLGVALVPRLAARHVPDNVRLLQPSVPMMRQIFAVSIQGGYRKPAVRVVLDALREQGNRSPGLLGPGRRLAQPGSVRR